MKQTLDRCKAIRAAIRYHRAQISDYRCWVDDLRLYQVAEIPGYSNLVVPSPNEFMSRCESFWDNRQRLNERGLGDKLIDSSKCALEIDVDSNADIEGLSEQSLSELLSGLQSAVKQHESKGFQGRSVTDDVKLYAMLPDQLEWNSSLPERGYFLSNCSKFCQHCQSHPESLLEWSRAES